MKETTNRYRFIADGKALASTHELESGDLIIEGWAAVFDGVDREDENFVEGAFQKGIREFLDRQATLAFHHRHDHGIGKVLDLREVAGKGLWLKARVDFQNEFSPLRWIYNGVKKGTFTALSVGGLFQRKQTPSGWRISSVDLSEVSITPVPVHPGTSFAVVAGKALADAAGPDAGQDWDALLRDAQTLDLQVGLMRAEHDVRELFEGRR